MFVFGQLVLAAILVAIPFSRLGAVWYVFVASYLLLANILIFFAWRKNRDVCLKVVSMDTSKEAHAIKNSTNKLFKGNELHLLYFCMMIMCAPFFAIPLLILSVIRSPLFWNTLIEQHESKLPNTLVAQIVLTFLKDFRDNGLFRSKL